jgi:hypothetical protein
MDESSSTEPFDPTRRKLCPDGTCVGVIGEDGRCGECRRTEAEAEDVDSVGDHFDAAREGAAGDRAPDADGFDPTTRRLCDDGNCVGIVGDDGLCRVCGRRSE